MIGSRKSARNLPTVPTASLPDIVFILLFFFMTVTVMKDNNIMVANSLPKATEAEKLTLKDGVISIFVGKPIAVYEPIVGKQPQIQLGNTFGRIDEVQEYVLRSLAQMPEHLRNNAIVTLKVDKNVGMGILADIKEALREVNFLKINYATIEGNIRETL